MDVVAARAHVAVVRGVDVEHLPRLACHGVQAEIPALLVPVPPLLEPAFVCDDTRRSVLEPVRNVVLEHLRGFGDVVVDADQDHVVSLSHGGSLQWPTCLAIASSGSCARESLANDVPCTKKVPLVCVDAE